jgi:hypothetical protein
MPKFKEMKNKRVLMFKKDLNVEDIRQKSEY